jgi:chorismate synthase
MKIESDRAEILSGVRFGKTLGSPIAISIQNRDWENWKEQMSVEPAGVEQEPVTRPRPGHADLAGALKYDQADIRNVSERASARETAARVAAGAVARALVGQFGILIISHVVRIGPVQARLEKVSFADIMKWSEASPLRCCDPAAEKEMREAIDECRKEGDSVGGLCEIRVAGCPPGLGSYVHWDRRLDARLAGALMSLPAVKGVEIGLGFEAASLPGSRVHDEIHHNGRRFYRRTNHAGGLEGGVSNGEEIVVRVAMKPIPTLGRPLRSVDMATRKPFEALRERADVCAVPSLGVIGEAVVAFEVAGAFVEKFGGDSLAELRRNVDGFMARIQELSSS